MNNAQLKAVGYIRVSTDDQVNNGVSLENQRNKITSYAEFKGYNLQIIEDAGYSAKNLNRPGMKKLLNYIKKRNIDAVIVYKLDRIFRNTIDALNIITDLDKAEISFHSINESIDTKSATGKFFFTILAAITEMERGIIGERTAQALLHKKNKGEKCGGYIPFGYDITPDKKLVKNDHEQKTLTMIKQLREKNYSYRKICNALQDQNIKTKRGGSVWHPQTVKQILTAS